MAEKKKYRKSKRTKVIGIRFELGTVRILEKRAKEYPGEMTPSQYIRMRMEYDLKRKHIKHRD